MRISVLVLTVIGTDGNRAQPEWNESLRRLRCDNKCICDNTAPVTNRADCLRTVSPLRPVLPYLNPNVVAASKRTPGVFPGLAVVDEFKLRNSPWRGGFFRLAAFGALASDLVWSPL